MKPIDSHLITAKKTILDYLLSPAAISVSKTEHADCLSYHVKFQGGDAFFSHYLVFPGAEILSVTSTGTSYTSHHPPLCDVMQINYCLHGKMGWAMRNGDSIYLGPGDMSIHMMDCCASSSITLPLESYLGLTIFLDLPKFNQCLPEALRHTMFPLSQLHAKFCGKNHPTILPASSESDAIFSTLEWIPEQYRLPYFQIKLQELLLFLCMQDLKSLHASEPSLADPVITVKKIRETLVSNLRLRPTIETLSKDFLINTATLKKVFKSVYGQPIAQYMKTYRMQRAAELLCCTVLSIGEISQAVGYENQSKFSAAFKEIMQISPAEYRMNCKLKNPSFTEDTSS